MASGKFSSVGAENVAAFYAKIQDIFKNDPSMNFAEFIANECELWSSRNIKKLFGRGIFKGIFGEELRVIFKIAQKESAKV